MSGNSWLDCNYAQTAILRFNANLSLHSYTTGRTPGPPRRSLTAPLALESSTCTDAVNEGTARWPDGSDLAENLIVIFWPDASSIRRPPLTTLPFELATKEVDGPSPLAPSCLCPSPPRHPLWPKPAPPLPLRLCETRNRKKLEAATRNGCGLFGYSMRVELSRSSRNFLARKGRLSSPLPSSLSSLSAITESCR